LTVPGEPVSQILVFNGMYFKGTWTTPFVDQKKDSFYKSDSEKSTVTMMSTRGKFGVGNVAELDSTAIELPYKVPLICHFVAGNQFDASEKEFLSVRDEVSNETNLYEFLDPYVF
jgi:serine protease inhibitor